MPIRCLIREIIQTHNAARIHETAVLRKSRDETMGSHDVYSKAVEMMSVIVPNGPEQNRIVGLVRALLGLASWNPPILTNGKQEPQTLELKPHMSHATPAPFLFTHVNAGTRQSSTSNYDQSTQATEIHRLKKPQKCFQVTLRVTVQSKVSTKEEKNLALAIWGGGYTPPN